MEVKGGEGQGGSSTPPPDSGDDIIALLQGFSERLGAVEKKVLQPGADGQQRRRRNTDDRPILPVKEELRHLQDELHTLRRNRMRKPRSRVALLLQFVVLLVVFFLTYMYWHKLSKPLAMLHWRTATGGKDFREEGTWFDVTQHEPVKGHASKKKEQLQVGTYRDRLKEEGKGAAKGVLVGELEGHDVKLGWGGGREVHHHHHHHGLKHKGTEEDVSAGKEAATVTNAKQDRRDMEERHDSNDEDKDERRNDAGDADGDGDGGEEEEEEAEEKTKKKAMVGLQGADDVDDERNDDMGIRIRKHRQEEKEKQAKMEKKKRRRGAKSRREKW